MSIKLLPEDAIDRIKSSATVTSLNEVACGLLANSLDAESSKVNIHIDYLLGNCVVEDNGEGISSNEFEETGGLGKPHRAFHLRHVCAHLTAADTSKVLPSSLIHGGHGNFLASVATFSLLHVISHSRLEAAQSYMSVHQGKVLTRCMPAPPELRFETYNHGTRISVRDLFGSMPVRVRQRGTIFADRSAIDREWAKLVLDVTGLLLGWPSAVSISLREKNTQRELRLSTNTTDLILRTSKLLSQAGLLELYGTDRWLPVSASSRRARINGCISKIPVATRRSQFMSLGVRPIPNSFGTNVLYEEVNKLFKESSFGMVEPDDNDGSNADGMLKARKGVEKWPVFYLQIHMLGDAQNIDLDEAVGDSRRGLNDIIDLLKVVCYGCLKRQFLRPRRVQLANESLPALSQELQSRQKLVRSKTRPATKASNFAAADGLANRRQSPFDDWRRIKTGEVSIAKPKRRPPDSKSQLVVSDAYQATQYDDRHHTCHRHDIANTADGTSGVVDLQTISDCARASTPNVDETPIARRTLDQPKRSRNGWLQGILDTWENPVFEPAPEQLRSLEDVAAPWAQQVGDVGSYITERPSGEAQGDMPAMLASRVSKAALASAQVIGQVDNKFILLRLSHSFGKEADASRLVLVDQHAADERCQLEDLMRSYFAVDTSGKLSTKREVLDIPIKFELSVAECTLLKKQTRHFNTWGVSFAVDVAACTVVVLRLPISIAERCRSEPKLVIDMMRNEIWRLADGLTPPAPEPRAGQSWPSSFRHCPRGILDLLNSRSCRSKFSLLPVQANGRRHHVQ